MTLTVAEVEINIVEPAGVEERVLFEPCFTAMVLQTLYRNAKFHLNINDSESNVTSADYDQLEPKVLSVPIGTSGPYKVCGNISILGDNKIEGIEMLVATLIPLSTRDEVVYPDNFTSLTVFILDNSSKYFYFISALALSLYTNSYYVMMYQIITYYLAKWVYWQTSIVGRGGGREVLATPST